MCDVAAVYHSFVRSTSGRSLHKSRWQANIGKRATREALPSQVDGAATLTAPSKPSKDLSVPSNLVPASDLTTVPGGKGRAVELKAGQYFKITNTHGEQVWCCDTAYCSVHAVMLTLRFLSEREAATVYWAVLSTHA